MRRNILIGPSSAGRWAIALFAAVAALAGAGAGAAQSLSHGAALLQRNCAMCHAVGATGDSPKPGAPAFRELYKRYPVENLSEALVEGILTGHPQMPEFRFTPEEVSDIIAYLKSIQTNQHARAGDSAAARSARVLRP
ncbi:MAG: cytochrome c [Caulobacteraceae bacterium]|nr:cytochrome c [Caulobacteraceae bacterium]